MCMSSGHISWSIRRDKYLGQVISEAFDDWPAVVKNLLWAREVWSRM